MVAPFPSPTQTWHDNTYASLSPSRPELSAKGKNILVTGGGTGIGAETAHYFAAAGASRIAILGRRENRLLETKASIESKYPHTQVFTAPTDVFKKDEVDSAFDRFIASTGGGKIDVVVSGAAITGPIATVKDADAAEYLDAVTLNLRGSFYTAQAFLRYAAEDAVAINISSSGMHLNFAPGLSPYCVAKSAIFRVWDYLGYENPGLRVYHVQPGVVNTEMNQSVGGVKAAGFEDHVSLPASFNLWLASPEARFLKGKYLWANWDVDELKARAKEIEETTQLDIQLVGWPFGEGRWTSNWKSEDSAEYRSLSETALAGDRDV
ncbi:SDR family NAD(P)-dependent oxidoreductase [Aspergillus lucknowensis]|uniref:Oxidoreductase n=1 Tax=Aspergillus lucknowensis TaxID=176173 RepID=A0ABR4LVU2_9EURO